MLKDAIHSNASLQQILQALPDPIIEDEEPPMTFHTVNLFC